VTDNQYNLAAALASYVPRTLVERLAADRLPAIGQAEHLEGVALFAGLSGITSLPDRLASYGQEGADAYAAQLNAIFSELIVIAHSYGGVVVSLGGDGLVALFFQDDALKLAVSCALRMQATTGKPEVYAVLGESMNRKIKIGLSKGSLALMLVGGVVQEDDNPNAGWRRALFAGDAIDRAVNCTGRAAWGAIVADPVMAAELSDVLTVRQLDAGFVLLEDVIPLAPPGRSPSPRASAKALRPYLMKSILGRIEAGEVQPPAILRRMTSMVVAFHSLEYGAPDDAGKLQRYLSQAGDLIQQHGGKLMAIMPGEKGGQLRASFDASGVSENIAGRAVRCALDLIALDDPGITGQQIGIASGCVFAGPVGSETRREYMVLGDSVDLSNHLAALAGPGQILLDLGTYRHVLEAFDVDTRLNVRVRGMSQPQTIYLVRGERSHWSALERRYLFGKRSLLGRDVEMAKIEHVVERAQAGEGQTLVISGPPGIGKMRLVEEVIRSWLLEGQGYGADCPTYALGLAYLPWTTFLREILVPEGPASATALHERLTSLCPEFPEATALLAPLLDVKMGDADTSLVALLDAEAHQQRLSEVVTTLLRSLAREKPLLLVLSGLHRSDALSCRLIEYVTQHIGDAPLLLCLEHRSDEDLLPGLDNLNHVTHLKLEPLSGAAGWQLIDEITHDMPRHRWPEALRDELEHRLGMARDEVIPLAVEETIDTLVQDGILVSEDDSFRVETAHQIDIPDRAQEIVMGRIDRLDQLSRDFLCVASVIGSPFSLPVLLGVYPQAMYEAEVVKRLDALEHIGVLCITQHEPVRIYSFRQSLMEEVIYDSLPAARRRDWHARVGEILEDSPVLDTNAAVLARHFDLGEQAEKASKYSLMAGEKAQELFDYPMALAYYQMVLRHLVMLPPEHFLPILVRLRLRRGRIFLEQSRFAELQSDIQETRRLALYDGDMLSVVRAGMLDAERCYWEEDYAQGVSVARATAQLAAEEGFREELAEARRIQGLSLHALGHSNQAIGMLTTALDLARESDRHPLVGKVLNTLAIIQEESSIR
jgi:class 3 adenylate cyclase/tetratricopeptide (TPR) repeat protein